MNNIPEWLEQPVVTGITTDPNQMKVTLSNIPNDTGLISRIFIDLAANEVNVDMISAVNDNGHSHLTFTFISGNYEIVRKTLSETLSGIEGWKFGTNEDVVKLAVVGVGMQSTPGVAGRFFGALSKHKIKMLATTTSEIKISVLLHKDESQKAVKVLAEEFGLLEAD